MTLDSLLSALVHCWEPDTAQSPRAGAGRASGQCAVSSVLIKEHFGGVILTATVGPIDTRHYWNQLENGMWIDSTRSQFGIRDKIRGLRIAPESMYWFEDTERKYKLLKSRVEDYLDGLKV